MDQLFTRIAARMATAVGQPLAFILAITAILLWAATGPVKPAVWPIRISVGVTCACAPSANAVVSRARRRLMVLCRA